MDFEKPLFVRLLLWPFALIYGLVVCVRNLLFDWEILPSKKFDVPVVSIGNITVGGTGKTPFSEYLIRFLKSDFKVGVLSRGYKRKTSGYRLVQPSSTPTEVGDEPYQVKSKFPDIMVAVDANRRRGISQMLREPFGRPDIILLDDAFQHRYVSPDINILLIDYNRMITEDHLLPVGNLREQASAKVRADVIVITKCPADLPSIQFRIIRKNLQLYPYQALYFTTLVYGEPVPVFPTANSGTAAKMGQDTTAMSLTGIASPKPFEDHVRANSKDIVALNFADHHNFGRSDLQKIAATFTAIANPKKIILTTEKDSVRLKNIQGFPEDIKPYLFYIPLSIAFLKDEGEHFNKKILNYLCKNKCLAQILSSPTANEVERGTATE